METVTTIQYRDGHTVTRTGTSGMTVTAIRNGEDVAVKMEFDIATQEEATAMIGTLLTQLEALGGENLVAQCFAHYAQETGKEVIKREGERDQVVIRGHKKR